MASWLREWVRKHGAWTALAVAVGLFGFGFFLNIIEDVLTGDSGPVDRLLLRRGHALAVSPDGNWMTPAAKFLSLLGNWQAIIPLGLLLMVLAFRRVTTWRPFAFYVLACLGSGALALGWKYLINRPRPKIVPPLEPAPFASFPSGHTLYALVAYGFLVYLVIRLTDLSRWLKALITLASIVLVLMIGASRVYLGTHYPSDVGAGLLIGVPWLMAVLLLFERGHRSGKVRAQPARARAG